MVTLEFAETSVWTQTNGFGCASLGLVAGKFSENGTAAQWLNGLEGTVLIGTYTQVLDGIRKFDQHVFAAVILFGNCGGENAFMHHIQELIRCPMVGGGAAIDGINGRSGLITGRGEVAVFLITDERYTFTAHTKNIHADILDDCALTFADPRTLLRINGMDAAEYLAEHRRILGLSQDDFEHLTLCDESGINAHLSFADGHIKSGRDLAEHMHLRYVKHDEVYEDIRKFYDDPNAIVFGCAGLGGLLHRALDTSSLGLFLFGEVCTVGDHADFGNLMLSKLCITAK